MSDQKFNLGIIMGAQFDEAKRWWNFLLLTKFILLFCGIIVVLTGFFTQAFLWITLFLIIFGSVAQWFTDRNRERAEALLRMEDFWKGLGWKPSVEELSELLEPMPVRIRKLIGSDIDRMYFSSKSAYSSRKLMENLVESAWFTKHLARYMARYLAIFLALTILVIISVLLFFMRYYSSPAPDLFDKITQVIIAIIVFLVAEGWIVLTLNYNQYANNAMQAEYNARKLLNSSNVNEIEAIRTLQEYQLARAQAPLIPEWLWNRKNKKLNKLWKLEDQFP